MGKTKTHILLCGGVLSIITYLLSQKIDGFIDNMDITHIFVYFFSISTLIAFEHIAMNA